MKELSIEQKAKAYDEALKVLHKYDGANIMFTQDLKDEMFPALKESEDEKIRKEIISFLKEGKPYHCPNSAKRQEWAAWLEKQGEQKPADKVELKFKVGDWVVCKNGSHQVFQVIERSWPNAKYRDIKGTEMFLNVFTLDKQYRPWTIQDAKDGDVLSYRDGQWIFIYKEIVTEDTFKYYALLSEKGITVNGAAFSLLSSCITPATKEQRDLLFQKMKEAGYEWDAEKKELKKIEQNSTNEIGNYDHKKVLQTIINEQNHDWSEEDKSLCSQIQGILSVCKSEDLLSSDLHKEMCDWLKSLKNRYTWKPSDEQMEALLKLEEMHVLEHEKNQENAHLYMVIKSIREQLLKLREE